MRLVDLVLGLILGLVERGSPKDVSEKWGSKRIPGNKFNTSFLVHPAPTNLSSLFCCQEFGAGIEPTPEKLYDPGSPAVLGCVFATIMPQVYGQHDDIYHG